jgi:hypothetical protein
MLSVCVPMYTPLQLFNQVNDFHENWYELCVIGADSNSVLLICTISNKHMARGGGGCANL